MAIEKKWEQIPPVPLVVSGTANGVVIVSSTFGFKTKQEVWLSATGEVKLPLEVKRVNSATQLIVGPRGKNLQAVSDISVYTTAKSATLEAYEQQRPSIPLQEHERAVYEEEPTVAKRTILVDPLGKMFSISNPVPVQLSDGSINIGTVNAEIEVQLSHKANDPNVGDVPDSVRIGDGVEELAINTDNEALVHDQDTHDRLDTFTATFQAESDETQSKIDNLTSVLQSESDATQALLQGEFDATQSLLQSEFDQTQTKLDTLTTTVQNESDQTQTLLQTEFDQTQVKLDTLTTTIQNESDATQTLLQAEFDQTQVKIDNLTSVTQTESDATQALLQSEFDATQTLLQTEFDQTQVKLDTLTTTVQNESDATQTLLQTEFDQTQTILQSEFDATQTLLQAEFDQTQVKLDTLNTTVQTEFDATQALLQTEFDQTQTKQDTGNTSLASVDNKLTTTNTALGATNETAPVTDIAASGLNGRLQRIAQRLTTLINDFAAYVVSFGSYVTANHADLLAVQTRQDTTNTELGATNETAPASDTAASGLNGRLQRNAQRLTTLITDQLTGNVSLASIDGKLSSTTGQPALNATGLIVRPLPFEPTTYSTSSGSFVVAATPTDVFTLIGSASKTIRINKIKVTGSTTSGSPVKITIQLIKRSTADTGGTSAILTSVPHDSTNAAATAVARSYTANPTLGTAVGTARAQATSFQAAGLTEVIEWNFEQGGQHLVLRGVTESIAINFNGTTVTGSIIAISIEWQEV